MSSRSGGIPGGGYAHRSQPAGYPAVAPDTHMYGDSNLPYSVQEQHTAQHVVLVLNALGECNLACACFQQDIP